MAKSKTPDKDKVVQATAEETGAATEGKKPAKAPAPKKAPATKKSEADIAQAEAELAAELDEVPAESGKKETEPKPAEKPAGKGGGRTGSQRRNAARGRRAAPRAEEAPSRARELDKERKKENVQRAISEQERNERTAYSQKFYSGISAIQESQRTKNILTGTVASIETKDAAGTSLQDGRKITMLSVILNGQYKVMIPFEEFFRDNAIDYKSIDTSTPDGVEILNRRQRQLAEKMYGATVDFVITHVEVNSPYDYSISGSRKQALEILEIRNFIGRRGMAPNYKEGDSAVARVLSVGVYSLRVNVCGVDANLPRSNLTFRYLTNLMQAYHVGDLINVHITKVTTRPKDGRVELEINAKDFELQDALERQKAGLISAGTVTLGEIVSVRPSATKANTIVISAWLPYFEMPATVRAMDPNTLAFQPKAGDKLRLQVTGFTERGFVLTTCHGYHDAPALFGRN